MIVRNADVRFVRATSKFVELKVQVFVAEAYAMLFGLQQAHEWGFSAFFIESDSQILVNAIHEDNLDGSPYGVIIEEIRESMTKIIQLG